MNAATLPLALAIIAGFLMAVQAPTNANLGKASGSPIVAAFLSFLVGSIALGAVMAGSSGRLFAPELRSVPWYAWLGGLYGAFFVAMAAYGAPKIGVGPLLTAAIAGQLLGAILLDHYGLLGLVRQPASIEKVGGVVLVLIGAWMVRRG